MVDPRPFLIGQLKETFRNYPDIGKLLPAMGYGDDQLRDLEKTINNCDCDAVIIGTPVDLNRIINIKKPITRVYYDLQSIGQPSLEDVIEDFLKKKGISHN
jgi:predicted GTPase